MFDTAKSGAVQMQKIALKAATEAASAAAEAAVQAVIEDSEPRERVARTARDPKNGQNCSSGSAQEKMLVAAGPTESRHAVMRVGFPYFRLLAVIELRHRLQLILGRIQYCVIRISAIAVCLRLR